MNPRRLTILLYAQHLSGVGHYVRTYEIARALAQSHEVHMFEGGAAVPRAGAAEFERIALPVLLRSGDGLATPGGGDPGAALRERGRRIGEAIALLRPDVLIVEHFPFSKWELEGEILAAIAALRAANPRARVLCSLRDIAPQTRHERVPAGEYRARVIELLRAHFDALLVHGDARLAAPEDFSVPISDLGIPVHYTGIVSEKPAAATEIGARAIAAQQPFALQSVGGGAGDAAFVDACLDTWAISRDGPLGRLKLLVFAGLAWDAERIASLQRRAAGTVSLRRFAPDFLSWLAAAEVAVTHAGYNTCANILQTGVRAVLVPDPCMSDQAPRAAKLARAGLAEVVAPEELSPETLAAAIRRALSRPAAHHALNLNGADIRGTL